MLRIAPTSGVLYVQVVKWLWLYKSIELEIIDTRILEEQGEAEGQMTEDADIYIYRQIDIYASSYVVLLYTTICL